MQAKTAKRFDIRPFTMIIALVVIWAIMVWLTGGVFISARNLSNLFVQMSVVGILASGMILIIISGNIDLSVGSLLGFLGGLAAILQVSFGLSTPLTIAATILAGLAIGLLQGWVIAFRKVPAFIVTLGGMMIFRGALLGVTNGKTVSPVDHDLRFLGQSYLSVEIGLALAIAVAALFLFFGIIRMRNDVAADPSKKRGAVLSLVRSIVLSALVIVFAIVMNLYKGIPIPVLIMLASIVICTILADKTIFGRSIYAIGGNKEASVYSGIKVKPTLMGTFILEGCLAAVGGLVLTARLNAGTVSAGQNLEMDVIAAAVIGGASLAGGVGTVPGTILGALVMASLNNGMSIMNVDAFWQYILKGTVLVVAVYVDVVNTKKD